MSVSQTLLQAAAPLQAYLDDTAGPPTEAQLKGFQKAYIAETKRQRGLEAQRLRGLPGDAPADLSQYPEMLNQVITKLNQG